MTQHNYALTINGQRVHSADTAQAINPATEAPICEYPLATREHLEEAVAAAKRAFPAWAATPLVERQQMVSQLGDLIEANQEAFIQLLITEQGKGRAAAEWEIGGSVYWCREIAKQSL
ncbi:MAG: aldehyde dehydrogenase family protein, partial [Hydrogenophaga sp.]|nr:aldehyde dehydrogenase family protein [Hydrogenophaga sp.]